jgi:hypothetical protein
MSNVQSDVRYFLPFFFTIFLLNFARLGTRYAILLVSRIARNKMLTL